MFTGIVKELGTVSAVERSDGGARFEIGATFADELATGDSVSVNGVCLTVTGLNDSAFAADVMNQSLSLTGLGALEAGDRVNLEPALKAGDPLGGHIVQGHVDCTGDVVAVTADGIATRIAVLVPERYRRYLVEHGSVTRRRREPDRGATDRRRLRGLAHPRDARAHDAWKDGEGGQGEPGVRRDRPVRRAAPRLRATKECVMPEVR